MKTRLFKSMLAGLMISCLAPAMQFSAGAEPPNPQPPSPPSGPGDYNPPLSEREPQRTVQDSDIHTQNAGQFSASDYKFAVHAARGGLMEVKMGEIASQKSSDVEIKRFGDRMVQDHGKAGKELGEIAARKGATLPTEPTAMEQRHIDHLNSLAGSDFDKAYVTMMAKDHKKDLKEFKDAAENAQDPDLKGFASRTAAVVEEHMNAIQQIERTMKSKLSQRD